MRALSTVCFIPLICWISVAHGAPKSIKDFGAQGDGVADDAPAFQQAVAAKLGVIDIPPGTYRLQSTIRVELDQIGWTSFVSSGNARLVMAAAGPAIHFVGTHGGTADPKSVEANVWERQRMPLVRGLEIVGEHPEANGIEVTGCMQFTCTETLIRQCQHGVHLTGRNRNLLISACHIYENRGCGVFYDHVNLHQSNIVGSHISYCAGGGVVIRGGEVRNVHIGTCDIESNMAPDLAPSANVLIDSTEGSTDEVAITGCTLQHNSKSPESANIRWIGRGITSARNPVETQEGHLTITGNVFSDVSINVHLKNARGVSIVGNTFWEGFAHDLLIENSQAIVVGPNDFDRNPRYVVNNNWEKDLNGIELRNCEDCKLTGFIVKGVWKKPAALLLDHCKRCTVTDISLLDNDGIGLHLKNCQACRVTDCFIRDDREEPKATEMIKDEEGRGNILRDNDVGRP